MSYELYCTMLHNLYIYGKITYRVYSNMTSKKDKTKDEYMYLYNSVKYGC